MVLKELILNNFYVGGVVVLNQLIFHSFNIRTMWCGNLERTDFEQLILWEGVHILKGLILAVSTTGRSSGIERPDF